MDAGDKFPEFVLKDENGDDFGSSSLKGKRYIIYFYSKDNTPGCTREAEDFTALAPDFESRGITIIGVSKDSAASHRKFIDSKNLKIKLLSDPDHILLEKAGAWGVKKNYGKEYTGTIRSTFLVGTDGTVEAAWKNVKATGHARRVLDQISS